MNVQAYVDEGRWIVRCPRSDCFAAYFAQPLPAGIAPDTPHIEPDGPRRIVCSCQSGGMGCDHGNPCAQRIAGVWPRQRKAISRVLAARKLSDRWYLPGETVPELKAQNVAMGYREAVV